MEDKVPESLGMIGQEGWLSKAAISGHVGWRGEEEDYDINISVLEYA